MGQSKSKKRQRNNKQISREELREEEIIEELIIAIIPLLQNIWLFDD